MNSNDASESIVDNYVFSWDRGKCKIDDLYGRISSPLATQTPLSNAKDINTLWAPVRHQNDINTMPTRHIVNAIVHANTASASILELVPLLVAILHHEFVCVVCI